MRAVVERISGARLSVGGELVSEVGRGILVLLGIARDDTDADIAYIIDKTLNLRIFEDEHGKMNLSLKDINGELLLVSQFTLMGDARHGRRPSYTEAGSPDAAREIYQRAVDEYKKTGVSIKTGVFQADMQVEHTNDGPVTILLDSRKNF